MHFKREIIVVKVNEEFLKYLLAPKLLRTRDLVSGEGKMTNFGKNIPLPEKRTFIDATGLYLL